MRDKNQIIKEINEIQAEYDNLIMEIGLERAQYELNKNSSQIKIINEKVELLKKAELTLKGLQRELKNYN